MQFAFGSGSLWGTNAAANSTPQNFGALQDIALDFSFSLKELRGRSQFPLTVARGAGKITGKAKTGNISAMLFNELFFSGTLATGKTTTVVNEAGSVPGTPFKITAANGATFVRDLGVIDGTTGVPLVKVATGPTTGQYSVDAVGAYTFAAADTLKAMLINYTYTTAAVGKTLTITNQLMGAAPKFAISLGETYEGKILTVDLYSCVSSKLTLPTKLEDFVIPEFDFEVMANAAGQIGIISLEE